MPIEPDPEEGQTSGDKESTPSDTEIFIEKVETIEYAVGTNEQSQAANDYHKSREKAKWTDIATVVLTVGIVLTAIIQAWIFNRQWTEMHTAGEQTDRMISAAKQIESDLNASNQQNQDAFKQTLDTNRIALKKNLEQSQASLNTTIHNFQRDQRAWIGLGEYVVTQFDAKEPFKLSINFVNSGKSPAVQTESYTAFIISSTLLLEPPFREHRFEKASAIPPQGKYTTFVTNFSVPPYFDSINDGKVFLYFYGQFRYHDVYQPKVVHTTSYCIFYDRTQKIMAFCYGGNDMN